MSSHFRDCFLRCFFFKRDAWVGVTPPVQGMLSATMHGKILFFFFSFLTNMRLHGMVVRRFSLPRTGTTSLRASTSPRLVRCPAVVPSRIRHRTSHTSRQSMIIKGDTFKTTFGCMHRWRPGALVTFWSRHRMLCMSMRDVMHGLRRFRSGTQ